MKNSFLYVFAFIFASVILISSCSEEEVKYQMYYADGLKIYKKSCQSCHMEDGTGLPGIIPPLTDTLFLIKNRDKLACIVKYGLNDTITVNGEIYDTPMPGETNMAAIDIAKVLTYITNSFGNKQGIYDVTETEYNINNSCK